MHGQTDPQVVALPVELEILILHELIGDPTMLLQEHRNSISQSKGFSSGQLHRPERPTQQDRKGLTVWIHHKPPALTFMNLHR